MRIGIDIRTLMDAQYSGVSEYTFKLIKALFRLDRVNEYVLFYNSGRDLADKMPEFDQPNVTTVARHYPNKIFNYFLQRALKRPRIDRLLGVDLFFMPHLNFIALSPGAQSVLTVHDLSFLRFPAYFSLRKNIWHAALGARSLIGRFERIVAVSESTKDDIVSLTGVDAGKITVISSGVSEDYKPYDRPHPLLKEVKERYKLPEKFILSLSTLEPRKNIESLVTAFDRAAEASPALAGCHLVIAGGRGWKYAPIERAVNTARNRGRIRVIGYVAERDKPALYNLASVFVYPSYYEGFGFPPLEAMACGIPAVVSNSSSLPEVAGSASLMVDAFNSGEIAQAIEAILADAGLAGRLRAAGLKAAAGFSWQKTARAYLDLFMN